MARPAPGAERSVAVLELLAAHPEERFTLSEVARRCDLNKATAHALLTALSERGVLLRHPEEKRYSLGPVLVTIGEAARRGYSAVDFADPTLRRLATETGLWARAWARRDDQLVALAEAGRPAAFAGRHPARLPLVPPIGAVAMAFADPLSVESWLARAPASEGARHAAEMLPTIRRDGYAVTLSSPEWRGVVGSAARPGPDPDGETWRTLLRAVAHQPLLVTATDEVSDVRIADVAAPVFAASGEVALVLSLTVTDERARSGDEVAALAALVVTAAEGLSATVGGDRR